MLRPSLHFWNTTYTHRSISSRMSGRRYGYQTMKFREKTGYSLWISRLGFARGQRVVSLCPSSLQWPNGMRIRRNPAVDRGKIAHICRKVKLRGKRRGGGKAGRHGDMLYPCLRFRGSILTSCPSGCLLEPAVVKGRRRIRRAASVLHAFPALRYALYP